MYVHKITYYDLVTLVRKVQLFYAIYVSNRKNDLITLHSIDGASVYNNNVHGNLLISQISLCAQSENIERRNTEEKKKL